MTVLTCGANAPISQTQAVLTLTLVPPPSGVEVDFSAFLLQASGKVRQDQDMVFYGQPDAGAVALQSASAGSAQFRLDLSRLDSSIDKLAFSATLAENRTTFAQFRQLELQLRDPVSSQLLLEGVIDCTGKAETALILAEVYRRQGSWKLRVIGQGFHGGLKPLAEHFGVEVEADTPSPAPTPIPVNKAPTPVPEAPKPADKPISLSKISLDKSRPSVSLNKKTQGFGEIRINLNWNSAPATKPGFFASLTGAKSGRIDLDLGCLYALQNGQKGVVQALGNCFGQYRQAPFIELLGDDRTGAITEGEWLRINGDQWSTIERLVVFAFIYEGVPNWAGTDAVVTLYVPEESPVEIRLNETSSRGMCALVLLENQQGGIKVSREIRYFDNHKDLDQAYRWGMRWVQGSK